MENRNINMKDDTKNIPENMQETFVRFNEIMLRAYSSYLLWKQIKISISPKDITQEEASRRLNIMNKYQDGRIFQTLLYSLENSFIIDLQKFFEKKPSSIRLINTQNFTLFKGFFLEKSDTDEIKNLFSTASIKKAIANLYVLRTKFVAHEAKDLPRDTKIYITEKEEIFSVVKQILKIIGNRNNFDCFIFDDLEQGTEQYFKTLLDDLECGEEIRYEN
jgi:hypothetical protein